jgi:hypothetical protein
MGQASGVFKQIAIKEETTYGVIPAVATGAQLLRRTDATFNLSKDTYESNEIRTDLQTADMRHGVRRVGGTLNGELSPGSYAAYLAALVKREFAAVTALTTLSLTVAGSGPTYTVTRASGSFLTSGLKIGQVVRLTAGTFNAANLNKNLFIVGLTALEATVIVLNGSALVAEGPIATATITVPGKTTYIPTTGHTDKSFSIEEWYSDIARSEVFSGCKFTKASVQLPPSGMATLGLDVAGKDHGQTPGSTRYFTSPTALSSSGVVAAVNGVLRVGGVTMASVTGLNFDIDASFTGDPVVGANVVPTQFAGRVKVTGQFTAYFEDGVIPAAFFDESELGIQVALTTSNDAAADFVSFSLSRVKLGGADKADSDGGVVRTYPFTALLNSNGGAGTAHEQSTIAIQDSLA